MLVFSCLERMRHFMDACCSHQNLFAGTREPKMFPNTFIFSCFPPDTPLWLVTRGCPGWSHLITWSSSKCPSPQTSHITPSLTHSLSRLAQETKPKICWIWVFLPHKGVEPLAYQRATGSISVSFVGWPDCPFSLASMPVCLTETSLDLWRSQRENWTLENWSGRHRKDGTWPRP